MKLSHRLKLDRMAVEEAGPDPGRMAAAIHAQLPNPRGPVPVHEIAYALDIVAIREAPTRGFEAALITPEERGEGVILINGTSSYRRQRYSIGHELGHFLNPAHQPTLHAAWFACTAPDLSASWSNAKSHALASRHLRQEAEANRFAIELLAPVHLVRSFLGGSPDLAAVVALADSLGLSREAGARRYVGLHCQVAAMVFSENDVVRYVERGNYFPGIARRTGQNLGEVPVATGLSGISDRIQGDPGDWLARPSSETLIIQTLHQRDGFAMTLLTLGGAAAAHDAAQ